MKAAFKFVGYVVGVVLGAVLAVAGVWYAAVLLGHKGVLVLAVIVWVWWSTWRDCRQKHQICIDRIVHFLPRNGERFILERDAEDWRLTQDDWVTLGVIFGPILGALGLAGLSRLWWFGFTQ